MHFRDYGFLLYLHSENLARRLQEYEIVFPQLTTESGAFLRNKLEDALQNERLHLTFSAFGEEFQLDLRKNRKLVDSKFTSEILGSWYQPTIQKLSRNCYYFGIVRSRSQSSVALSGCHGLVRKNNFSLFSFR